MSKVDVWGLRLSKIWSGFGQEKHKHTFANCGQEKPGQEKPKHTFANCPAHLWGTSDSGRECFVYFVVFVLSQFVGHPVARSVPFSFGALGASVHGLEFRGFGLELGLGQARRTTAAAKTQAKATACGSARSLVM